MIGSKIQSMSGEEGIVIDKVRASMPQEQYGQEHYNVVDVYICMRPDGSTFAMDPDNVKCVLYYNADSSRAYFTPQYLFEELDEIAQDDRYDTKSKT
jgi:hypothetical protein